MDEDRRIRDGVAVIGAVIILALIGLTMLVGCTTREIVAKETSWVHDTVVVHKSDTLWDYKFVTQRDTVRQESVHTVVLNNAGDTIRETHYHHNTEKVLVVDSTYKYKAERDSLMKALHARDKESRKEKKQLTWWDTFMCALAGIALLVAMCMLVVWAKGK